MGRLTVVLWIGMLATVAWIIVAGFAHFDAHRAFDFPPHAFTISPAFMASLGAGIGSPTVASAVADSIGSITATGLAPQACFGARVFLATGQTAPYDPLRLPQVPDAYRWFVAHLLYRAIDQFEAVPEGPDEIAQEAESRRRPYAVRAEPRTKP